MQEILRCVAKLTDSALHIRGNQAYLEPRKPEEIPPDVHEQMILGNNLAVRIAKAFVREAHIARGTPVDLSVDDGKIVIDPHTELEFPLNDLDPKA